MTTRLTLAELSQLPIPKLRSMAAAYGLPLRRDMDRAAIAALIYQHESSPAERVAIVEEGSDRPKPGWARITIHRDPSPHAGNSDVFLGVNGYCVLVKRGVMVDVPIKILRGALMDSVTEVVRENQNAKTAEERFTFELVHSYPFTVHDINEGPDPRDTYERTVSQKMKYKRKFKEERHYWPKPHELREYMRTANLED